MKFLNTLQAAHCYCHPEFPDDCQDLGFAFPEVGSEPVRWKIGIKDLFDVFLGLNNKIIDPLDNYRDGEDFSLC